MYSTRFHRYLPHMLCANFARLCQILKCLVFQILLALAFVTGSAQPTLADCSDPPAPNVQWIGCDFFALNNYFIVEYDDDLDLAGANLHNSYFFGSDMSATSFENANLTDVRFADINLSGANMSGANLTRVNFIGDVNLENIDFTNAWYWHPYGPLNLPSDIEIEFCVRAFSTLHPLGDHIRPKVCAPLP